MYSATCPRCGTTIYASVLGQAWLACQSCQYFGMLLTTPLLASPSPSQLPVALAAPSPAPSPTPEAAEAPLSTLQQLALRYGEKIAANLATFTPHDSRLSLTQVWDRMQQATDALFGALGERRMGDYPPDIESVTRALTQIGAWHIIALQVAGQLQEPSEGA